jgi:serine/threonine protein kinase
MQDNSNLNDLPILDDKYYILKKLGSGATCKVKLGLDKETNELCAIKILTQKAGTLNTTSKHYFAEFEMLKKINHKNIINLKGANKGQIKKSDGRTKLVDYIVLELAENGELFDYLYFPKKGFSEPFARYIFKELIEGLEACHLSGVAHRDLKTENIMMNRDWTLKIADFGYATLLAGKTGSGVLYTCLGTLSYAAPEILNKKPYSGSCVDVFACGVILFVLVTGKLPFGKAVIFDSYYKNFIKNDYEAFWAMMSPKLNPPVSEEFKSLIDLLLAYDPSSRPSISEIKSHPWMTGEIPSKEEIVEEFEKRKEIVTRMRKIEAEEQQLKKKKCSASGANKPGKVYKSVKQDNQTDAVPVIEGDRNCHKYVDGGVNPYKVKLCGKSFKCVIEVMNFIAKHFTGKCSKIEAHPTNAKIKIINNVDDEVKKNLPIEIEDLILDAEVTKECGDYIVEFNKVSGDKLEFFEAFEQFVNSIKS